MTSLVRVLKKLSVCLALVWLPFISQAVFAYNGPALDQSEFSKILTGKSTAKKQQAIYWLVRTQPADIAHPILSAWLNGQLYHPSNQRFEHRTKHVLYLLWAVYT